MEKYLCRRKVIETLLQIIHSVDSNFSIFAPRVDDKIKQLCGDFCSTPTDVKKK